MTSSFNIEHPWVCFYHQCRWGASAQLKVGTAATFSSWPGNVRPTAPAAESALKLLSCTGTCQTENATPGPAQRETPHLDRDHITFWLFTVINITDSPVIISAIIIYSNLSPPDQNKPWQITCKKKGLFQNCVNFTLLSPGFQTRICDILCNVLLCRFFNLWLPCL